METKKRLFAVRHHASRKSLNEFFSSKFEAKKRRNELNGQHEHTGWYVVTVGPDHKRYKPH